MHITDQYINTAYRLYAGCGPAPSVLKFTLWSSLTLSLLPTCL